MAHYFIKLSLEYLEIPYPRISKKTLRLYNVQLDAKLNEGIEAFSEFTRSRTRILLPDLVNFFEDPLYGEPLPYEMYWGMTEVAQPFNIQLGWEI